MIENMPNCLYRISSKALILDEQKRFLLVKTEPGYWELPWGWLELWEHSIETIIRELQEEMNITPIKVAKVPSYFVTGPTNQGFWVANIVYETQINHKDLSNIVFSYECQEFAFFTKEEALKLKVYPNIKNFIESFDPDNH